MKTIKALRTLIKNNDGKFRIGKLVFRTDGDNSDIDIQLDDKLIAWVEAANEPTTPLEDVLMSIATSLCNNTNHSEFKQETRELQGKIKELEDKIKELEQAKEQAQTQIKEQKQANAKSEYAQELLDRLLSRNFTISAEASNERE